MRLGVVGTGPDGRRWMETIKASDEARLAGVVSRRPFVAGQADCVVTPDVASLLDRVDGLVLAVPPAAQVDIALQCLPRGVPLLLEKPLALSAAEAAAVQDAAATHGTLAMVNHTHLYGAAMEHILGDIRRDEPLRIDAVGGNWGPFRPYMSALWDYGPHDLAMCLALTGEPPRTVDADLVRARPAESGGGLVVRIDLTFPGGHTAGVLIGNLMEEKRRTLRVTTPYRTYVYDDLAEHRLTEQHRDGPQTNVPLSAVPPFARLLTRFCGHVRAGTAGDGGVELGVQVVRVLEDVEDRLRPGMGSRCV